MNVIRFSDLCAAGQVAGKRVFIRADLNVPQDDQGRITEDTRIRASVPAIRAAAASVVCYCVGITSVVDPIRFRLIFERFLNPERKSMPDIDVDARTEPPVVNVTVEPAVEREAVATVRRVERDDDGRIVRVIDEEQQ